MKSIILAFVLTTSISFGQVHTTVQDGDFWSPLTWDCTCFPADGDSLVLNHDIVLSSGIAYTSGQIHISSSGSLDQGANNFSFYINGGSLINEGTLIIDNLLLDTLGFIENHGTANLDSVWTRSTATNTGTMTTDAFAHDQNATFMNSGDLDVTNNFNNQGLFINSGIMSVGQDASNCNLQSDNAVFDNDGTFCLVGDFLNCGGDTLKGNGTMYFGGASTNDGQVEGNLTINTSTGSFSVNLGNIESSVQFGTATCGVGLDEAVNNWSVYPNPATTVLTSTEMNVKYKIFDLTGRIVSSGFTTNGTILINQLTEGTYLLQMENDKEQSIKKTFIKL